MTRTVVALFDNLDAAQNVVQDLVNNGIRRDDISLVASQGNLDAGTEIDAEPKTSAGGAAGIGAVVGGLAGLLVGLGALAIPGVGPILAAGPLAATLAGAGIGAVTGGLAGALIDTGVPQEEAQGYAEAVRRGGTLVMVRTTDPLATMVQQVFDRHHAAEVQTHASGWGQQQATPPGQEFDASARADIPAGSQPMEPPVQPTARAFDNPQYSSAGSGGPAVGPAGGPAGGPEYAEQGWQPAAETGAEGAAHGASKGAGFVGASGAGPASAAEGGQPPFEDYRRDYQEHYELVYGGTGRGFRFYEPMYRFGYSLAGDERYRGRKWSEIEPEAARAWQAQQPGVSWDQASLAVRHGWERAAQSAPDLYGGTDQPGTTGTAPPSGSRPGAEDSPSI